MVDSNLSLLRLLMLGSRPRTLPAAFVPVLVGVATVESIDSSMVWRAMGALVVSVALQVAVNFANDYSDGIKGTDADRVGPVRLVGSGLVEAPVVKRAALAAMGLAAVVGAWLALSTSLWLLGVGAVAMVAAWTYTGGPRPYGYAALGEVFVFIFFGVVATVGTQYVVGGVITSLSIVASVGVGALACVLLVVNNLRDIHGDAASGKITLAVRLGDAGTRRLFIALFVLAAMSPIVTSFMATPWTLLALIGIAWAWPPITRVIKGAEGAELIRVLGQVGMVQLFYGVAFALGLWLSFN